MKSFNLYNSKIFKFFDYVFRIVLINLLIFVPSFLLFYIMSLIFKNHLNTVGLILTFVPTIFYLFPAICAGIDLVRKYELHLTNGVFKEFFKSFKTNYVKALLETFIILIFAILLANSLFYFYNNIEKGIIYGMGFVLTLSFTIMILAIVIHLPLVMNYMEGCHIFDDIKLAGMMAFKDLAITLALVIFIAFFTFLAVTYDTIMVIGGFGFPIYLIVKLTFKKYYIVYIRTHKNKE